MRDREKLLRVINSLNINEIYNDEIIRKSIYNNVWFTERNISDAVAEVKRLTEMGSMSGIAALFPENKRRPKEVAVVLSGDTPLENFRDFLYILISGNCFAGKISHDDPFLLKAYADALIAASPN